MTVATREVMKTPIWNAEAKKEDYLDAAINNPSLLEKLMLELTADELWNYYLSIPDMRIAQAMIYSPACSPELIDLLMKDHPFLSVQHDYIVPNVWQLVKVKNRYYKFYSIGMKREFHKKVKEVLKQENMAEAVKAPLSYQLELLDMLIEQRKAKNRHEDDVDLELL